MSDVKGVALKDRLGNYVNSASGSKTDLKEDRLADVKGVPGVKDRLGTYVNAANAEKDKAEVVAERLADVKGVPV